MVDVDIMGEKEFSNIMKTNNMYLNMKERHLIASKNLAFTDRMKQDDSNR